jgi:hypothetical protein
MAKLTSKKCPNCGAPIALNAGQSDVSCQYCGNVIHVEWGKKAPAEKPPMTVYVKRPGFAMLPLLIVLGSLVPIAIPLFVAFGPKLKNLATAVAAESGIPTGKMSFPTDCGMNRELTIIGQTFEGAGTLVTGDVNCKIKIKDSKLKGDIVVLAKNLVEITVENSTLEGKEAAVRLGMNSKLFARTQTVLKGEEAGVIGGINSELSLDGSTIEGAVSGFRAEANCKLTANGSRISGKEFGIRSSSNLSVEGRELVISGGRVALESEVNLKLDLRGGTLEGGEAGVRTKGPNANLKLTRQARIAARETALNSESNLQLEMEDAVIDGGEIGVETGANPKLSLGPKARIHGGNVAVKAGVNLELEMRSATIESELVGLCAPFNIEIQARESTIRAGADAFRFQRRPQQLELATTSVSGGKLFNVQGCSPSRKK